MGQQIQITNQQKSIIQGIYGKYNQIIFDNGNLTIKMSKLTQELNKSNQGITANIAKFNSVSQQQKTFIQVLTKKYGQFSKFNIQSWTIQK